MSMQFVEINNVKANKKSVQLTEPNIALLNSMFQASSF